MSLQSMGEMNDALTYGLYENGQVCHAPEILTGNLSRKVIVKQDLILTDCMYEHGPGS